MDIILAINKPKDITSQEAVTKVKKLLKVKKAGHTGTLDPMATGLMIICINRATRLATYFTNLDKTYKAVMKLGEVTDTQDAYGQVIQRTDISNVDKKSAEQILSSFKGEISQLPPMYSALKHKGKALYKYARKGIDVERKPRKVTIRDIELTDFELPFISFTASCSKGTYIRTLCNDVGEKLESGGHLTSLERTVVGPFSIEKSLTFEELKAISEGDDINKGIYTMDEALPWLPEFKADKSMLRGIVHGNPINLNGINLTSNLKEAPGIKIKSHDNTLLAIGSYNELKKAIKMDVVFT